MKRYERINLKSYQDIMDRAAGLFPSGAKLYAVLDYAVCFGIYENPVFSVGLRGKLAPVPLEWEYLRELRMFDESKELYVVCEEEGWNGRIRSLVPRREADEEDGEYTVNESQKLWGRIKDPESGIPGWSLLVSDRGTNIQIPVELRTLEDEAKEKGVDKAAGEVAGKAVNKTAGKAAEVAIRIRKFYRIPDVEKEEELVYLNDFCMVKFCLWEGGADSEK